MVAERILTRKLRLKIGQQNCPQSSLNNYQPTPRNTAEERRPPLRRGGSLKSGH